MKRRRNKKQKSMRMAWLLIPYGLLMITSLIAGLLTGERLCFLLFFTQLALLIFCGGVIVYTIASFSFLQPLIGRAR